MGTREAPLPYQPSVSVPLVLRDPQVRRGAGVRAPVSTLDLTATFLDYGEAGMPPGMDSRSLRNVLRGENGALPPVATAAYGDWKLVSDGRHKLISGFDPSGAGGDDDEASEKNAVPPGRKRPPVLFDLENIPCETTGIAQRRPDLVRKLSRQLQEARS